MMVGLKKMVHVIVALIVGLGFQSVWASAVKTIYFVPKKVYTLKLSPLYSAVVKLQGIKRIWSIHCGDAGAWEILRPIGSANSIVIKPRSERSETDLIIRADKHDLLFKIQARPEFSLDPLLFATVSFPKKKSLPKKSDGSEGVVNHYCYRGDPLLRPGWAYDNGEATYFHWDRYSAVPAIYRITPDQKEKHMVNFRVRNKVFRVPALSDQWLVRKGAREGRLIYFDLKNRRCDG